MLNSHPLVDKFQRLFHLTPAEHQSLAALQIRPVTVASGQDLVREGDRPSRCVVMLAGLAGTSKVNESGKRQITAFHLPGDMPDLLSLHLEVLDSDIRTISACIVAFLDHNLMRALCEQHPRLAAGLWRTTLVDASIFREWVVNVGQRRGPSRLAHLFCETMRRMEAIGLADNQSCEFLVTQGDLSEATGMSAVHLNRSLQMLRKRKLLSFSGGTLTIHDWEGLAEPAGFRADYLHIAGCAQG